MKTKTFMMCLCILLTLLIIRAMPLCEGQLQWRTSIQIDIHADDSATWVIQQTAILTNETDIDMFWQTFNITYMDQVSNQINSMVDHATLITGRSMRVDIDSLEVIANVSSKGLNKEGIILYQFDWIGFAEKTGGGRISLGDAFSGEIDLAPDDTLSISYPSEYVQIFIYPSPDKTQESEKTLTWLGPRNFGSGEPHALFDKRSFSWTDAITSNMALFVVLIVAISASLSGYFVGTKRLRMNKEPSSNYASEQKSLLELSVEDDQEKVLRVLRAGKGSVLQSMIAKQCRFSKSKASELLSIMESDGVVTRKKMGRERIVTLVEKEKT